MKSKVIWILSLGHLITDINQGALPAMLPFFISAYDLSYTAAASIVFAANLASSIIQPIFGYAADRFSKPWLLCAGLILAGAGLGLTGLCETYQSVMLLVVVSGIGIAAYHPEAARMVNIQAGKYKNSAMSLFGVGGTIGFAIGPFLITTALLKLGLRGSLILILPVSVMAVFMASQFSLLKSISKNKAPDKKKVSTESKKENWWAFIRLTVVIVGRSVIFYGLNTFIPIYWIHHLHQSKIIGSLALTVFAGSGIIGNLLGGALADRFGSKKIVVSGFLGLMVMLPIFIFVDHTVLALFLVVPIGLILYATYSPSIVMGQSYLPNRVGLSSGITLGVAISIGGAVTPLIGKISDIHGVWAGLMVLACLPVFFCAIAMTLPELKKDS